MKQRQWNIAHDLAFDLVDWGTDPNELGKVVAFVRRNKQEDKIKDRLTSLVQRLSNTRNALIRSRQTQRFYSNIQEAFEKHLHDIEDTNELLLILGWSLRLMRYYKVEPKRAIEEQLPQKPEQQKPTQPSMESTFLKPEIEKPKIKVGDKVNATVLKKAIPKVTVQLHTDDEEELVFQTGWFQKNVGDEVKVKVQTIDTDGKVKKITPG